MRCSTCGVNMRQQNHGRGRYGYFICKTYSDSKTKGDDNCTRHSIRCDALEEIVLAKIQETIADARADKEKFARTIQKSTNQENEKALKSKTSELAKTEKRIAELDKIISRIYEDHIGGTLSKERFTKMLAGYETEQTTLYALTEKLKSEIQTRNERSAKIDSFIKLVERFGEITELTTEIARTFIQKIVVHEAVKTGGFHSQTISQKIEIYFNHIGEYNSE